MKIHYKLGTIDIHPQYFIIWRNIFCCSIFFWIVTEKFIWFDLQFECEQMRPISFCLWFGHFWSLWCVCMQIVLPYASQTYQIYSTAVILLSCSVSFLWDYVNFKILLLLFFFVHFVPPERRYIYIARQLNVNLFEFRLYSTYNDDPIRISFFLTLSFCLHTKLFFLRSNYGIYPMKMNQRRYKINGILVFVNPYGKRCCRKMLFSLVILNIVVCIIFVGDFCLLKHAVNSNHMLLNVTLGFAFDSKTFSSASMLCIFLYFKSCVRVCVCILYVFIFDCSWTAFQRSTLSWQVDETLAVFMYTLNWMIYTFTVDIRMIWVQTLKLSEGMIPGIPENSFHLFEFHKLQTNRLSVLSGMRYVFRIQLYI